MGIRLLAGRSFTKLRQNGVAEAMIDTGVARRFFPDGSAVGSQIRFGERLLTIVGIVSQPRLYGLYTDGRPQVLVRAEDFVMRPLFYVMRTTRALGALLLTAMGLFGIVAGSVIRRRHELAVRLAVGADHPRILRMVLGEGALLVSAGLFIGAPGLYFGYRMIRGLLVGVSPYDPLALLVAASGLFTVAMAACYVPARRVLKIDPSQMLHQ